MAASCVPELAPLCQSGIGAVVRTSATVLKKTFGLWPDSLWDKATALTLRVWLSADPWPAEEVAAFLSPDFLC